MAKKDKGKKAAKKQEQLKQQQEAAEAREKQSKRGKKAAKKQAKRDQAAEQAAVAEKLHEAATDLVEQNRKLVGAIEMSIAAAGRDKKKKGRKKDARNRGGAMVFKDAYESGDHDTGQDRPRHMKPMGPSGEALEAVELQVVDKPISQTKLDALAFNEEKIEVIVHDSQDETAIPIPDLINDGLHQNFIRGQRQIVRRKFVEMLAGLKKTTYTHIKVRDDNGDESYDYIPHSVLAYPFLVINDPNPRGQAWLAAIQQRD